MSGRRVETLRLGQSSSKMQVVSKIVYWAPSARHRWVRLDGMFRAGYAADRRAKRRPYIEIEVSYGLSAQDLGAGARRLSDLLASLPALEARNHLRVMRRIARRELAQASAKSANK